MHKNHLVLLIEVHVEADVPDDFGLPEHSEPPCRYCGLRDRPYSPVALQVTLLSEHLRDEEDDDGPKKTPSGQQVHKRIPGRRQQNSL